MTYVKKGNIKEDIKKSLLKDIVINSPSLFYLSLPKHNNGITLFKHQIHTLYNAMVSRPIRMLIADEIGLGKTLQALAISRYLQINGEVKKILVLVPKILREQWKNEILRIGGIPEVIEKGQDIDSKLKFADGRYIIASIDLAKRANNKEKFLKVDWDLVIVDEVHNISIKNQRYKFLKELIKNKKEDLNIIFLSATPHRGNSKDYLAKLALLDTKIKDYTKLDFPNFYKKTKDTIVFRRNKKVVNELEGREIFKKCKFRAVVVDITEEEKKFLNEIDKTLAELIKNAKDNSPEALLAVLVRKRASSSYEAAIKTISKIAKSLNSEYSSEEDISEYIKSLFGLSYDDLDLDDYNEYDEAIEKIIERYAHFLDNTQINAFNNLLNLAQNIKKDSKLDMVARIVAYHIKNNEKVIIFTEFKDTLSYISRKLPKLLEKYEIYLNNDDISIIYGGLKNREIKNELNKFKRSGKLLISTDVASEGLNLQVASVLINYESPWSPIKLEQRVGRIWRLNQKRETTSYTLFLASEADMYILNNLYQKIMNITEAVGLGPQLGIPMFSGDFDNLWKFSGEFVDIEEEPSEYKLILATIKKELSGYAEAIINMLKKLKSNIERYIPTDTVAQIESELNNILTKEDIDEEFISKVLYNYISNILNNKIPNIYSSLYSIVTSNKSLNVKLKILVKGKLDTNYLFYITLVDTQTNRELHRFPVLVSKNIKQPIYGINLIEYLINILSNEYTITFEPITSNDISMLSIKSHLISFARENIYKVKSKFEEYDKLLIRNLLRESTKDYLFKNTRIEIKESLIFEGIDENKFDIISKVPKTILNIFNLSDEDVEIPNNDYYHLMERNFVPLKDILECEQKAMDIVMQLERNRLIKTYGENGDWSIEDVSLKEHYDIKVIENGKEKYIEVKGHKPLILTAELTQAEYNFAKKNVDKYWIYIVANLGKNKPIIIKLHNPFSSDSRIYAITNEGDIDITNKVNIHFNHKMRHVLSINNKF